MALKAVTSLHRKKGNAVMVYSLFDKAKPMPYALGEITKITKKFVTLGFHHKHEMRFHRATGYVVGFAMFNAYGINPETS